MAGVDVVGGGGGGEKGGPRRVGLIYAGEKKNLKKEGGVGFWATDFTFVTTGGYEAVPLVSHSGLQQSEVG
jgi:hypothetical protein